MSLIKLSNILKEISEIESERILSKIRNKNFQFFDSGDNGKVYTIDGEDLLMKITSEPDEVAVADVIVGQYDKYNAFIPVVYTDNKKMYIMKRASKLSPDMYTNIDNFYEGYKDYARQQGVETSIFEYFNNNGARNINQKLASFLSALEQQVKDTGIGDLELSLDFKPDNIMSWNGNLVMVDW
jgi:hypothetical protein|tara:strand:- start:280 stop:828 length:549 start_codon:yes stop_codon:yes gene_type:complete